MPATNKNDLFIENIKLALANLTVYDSTIKFTDLDELKSFPTYSVSVSDEKYEPTAENAGGRAYCNVGTTKFHVFFRYPVKTQPNLNLVLDSLINKWTDIIQTNLEKRALRKTFTYTDKANLSYTLTISDYRITDVFKAKDTDGTPSAMILFDGVILYTKTV